MNRNAMLRMVFIWILWALSFVGAAAVESEEMPYNDVPQKNTPRKLQEAWLRFHESGLCQDVDAAFVFAGGGMQVWSRIESDKSYSKFRDLFESLRNLHRVDLYTNRLQEGRESGDGDNPPPSLWQNYELRSNLGDRPAQLSLYKEEPIAVNPEQPDLLLKQRLLVYAEQTLDRNRKGERYALDLFALARTADNPDMPPDIRSRATAICLEHAKSLERNIGKLASDLGQAIPRAAKGERESIPPDVRDSAKPQLTDEAERIFRSAQDVAARVHRYFYPEDYTVELDELRKPGIFQSLKALQRAVLDFQGKLVKSGRQQPARKADRGP